MNRNESETSESDGCEPASNTENANGGERSGYDRRSFMAITGVASGFGAFGSYAGFGRRTDSRGEVSTKSENGCDVDENESDVPTGTEALLGYVEANYGDRLSESDLETIGEGIAADLDAAAAVSEVALENSDAPAFDFAVYRGEG